MPNPEDLNYKLPYPFIYQMRQDEAIVLIGQTPPPVRYFGLQTWVQMGPASPAGAAVSDNRTLIGAAFGDSVNNLTVHTTGPDPFSPVFQREVKLPGNTPPPAKSPFAGDHGRGEMDYIFSYGPPDLQRRRAPGFRSRAKAHVSLNFEFIFAAPGPMRRPLSSYFLSPFPERS